MRNEMVGAVVRRAIEHPEFRKRLVDDPQEALSAHGFALESAEMDEIEKIRTSLEAHHGSENIEQRLMSIAEEYGVHPHPSTS
jgi:hypothetical protein